jgi:hypothetical protein
MHFSNHQVYDLSGSETLKTISKPFGKAGDLPRIGRHSRKKGYCLVRLPLCLILENSHASLLLL